MGELIDRYMDWIVNKNLSCGWEAFWMLVFPTIILSCIIFIPLFSIALLILF